MVFLITDHWQLTTDLLATDRVTFVTFWSDFERRTARPTFLYCVTRSLYADAL